MATKDKKNDSQDEGNPTEDVSEDVNTAPDGQTATGDTVGEGGDDFPEEEAPPAPAEDDAKPAKIASQLAKALGLKSSDVLSYNERTRTAVMSNGGKYQVSKNGKSLRHLAGPFPPEDLKMNVIDARTRSSLTGASAVINSQGENKAG